MAFMGVLKQITTTYWFLLAMHSKPILKNCFKLSFALRFASLVSWTFYVLFLKIILKEYFVISTLHIKKQYYRENNIYLII